MKNSTLMLTLYDYFRSSASYRVRIALNLKQVNYNKEEIHLVNEGGAQHSQHYRQINPQGLIPSVCEVTDQEAFTLHQSLAIFEYLEDKYPTPRLLPADIQCKAQVRSFAYKICCDIHPLNNLRVLNYLEKDIGITEEQRLQWYDHWIEEGFKALEEALKSGGAGNYCFGDSPTLADICLIPQVYNAKRFHVDLTPFAKIITIYDRCMDIEAFNSAKPIEPN